MTIANPPKVWTSEELDALPDDGVERWIINGELSEKRDGNEDDMTRRNRGHSRLSTKLAQALANWLDAQPQPRGEVLTGEASFRLRRNPDSNVGIDVAYMSPAVAQANAPDARTVDGAPVLAVEILSPSDKQEEITEKIEAYLACGVALVWIIEPKLQTVTVYRPDAKPQLFNVTQTLDASPHLPGFRLPVADIFAR